MIFNSIQYLLFFPFVLLIYYIVPKKVRYIWLLIASYYFYMCWNFRYIILMVLSTLITYLGGLGIQRCSNTNFQFQALGKLIVIACFVSNLCILVTFKYLDWIIENISNLLHENILLPFHLMLPVGISFYTFQVLGYIIDVYRGEIEAEKNILRYALFVSFFPQLVAGPIEKSKNLIFQLKDIDKKKIDFNDIRNGLCLILYGLFLKIVLADRMAILINAVFDNYLDYGFIELTVAASLFAIQILCDFNGYTIIAQGSAIMLGIKLVDNFRQPYLATSIQDFWRRWHISLTSWFTSYLYIPLGGNRKGSFRKIINILIVFFMSGIWHGASWHYVAWGGLHGIYQSIGEIIHILKKNNNVNDIKIKFSTRIIKIFVMFTLTDIAWVFFRAPSCKIALSFFHQMFSAYQKVSLLALGLQWYDWLIIVISLLVVLGVDILHERGIRIRKWLYAESIWFRWLIYLMAFWGILLFGIYGVDYDTSQFIYFQF